jgi:Ca-activated chloride channel homolog
MQRAFRFSISFVLLALASLSGPVGAAAQDDDVIKVDSSLVVLNAVIQDRSGRHVSGLERGLFTVFEDGTPQEVSFFAAEETPFAAVLLIDSSGSMETRVSMARAAAIRFLEGLREQDNAAIYRFASKVVMVQDFSPSRDVADALFDIKADGMTAMNDAIFLAAEKLALRPEKRRAIVVLSDGEDTFSGRSASKALDAALRANAVVYTVDMSTITGVGTRRVQNRGVLKELAEKSGGRFITTPGGAALRDAFKSIVDELGTHYTLGYYPANAKKDGKWRAIELRVSRPNLTIRTRAGYTAGK